MTLKELFGGKTKKRQKKMGVLSVFLLAVAEAERRRRERGGSELKGGCLIQTKAPL